MTAAIEGLTSTKAAARLVADGPNELPSARPRTLTAIVVDVVREPMLLLLIATGVVYVLLGDIEEALAVLGAIGVVIGISVYQAQKTERALHALRDLSSPRALVIRDGTQVRIAGRDVVCGDVVVLREGDRVPADGVVLSSTNLAVDESLLTGESVPVRKAAAEDPLPPMIPGGDDHPYVYSGSLVVRGAGFARVTATGAGTELGKIGASLASIETGRTALQAEVDRVVIALAVAGLAVCAAVTLAYVANGGAWLGGVLAGLTAAISMVPEEFPVVLTIFLALGAWRLSRGRVLTRRVPAIERLGAATVLCVDKTGTLTLNRMTVTAIAIDGEDIDLLPDARELPQRYHSIVEAAVLASRPDPFDPMERAFAELAARAGVAVPQRGWTLVEEYPLSDRLLAVTQAWKAPDSPAYVVATKGAPEAIARLCGFDAPRAAALAARVASMADRGLRVLGVAHCRYVGTAVPDSPFDFRFTWLGLVGLSDPVRPNVPAAILECRSGGIRVVMITGDHPATAVAIGRQIGLAEDGGYLPGADISALADDALRERVASADVFARIVPEQKLRLVTALQARGDVVGMTGDGVNDAPALKAADIGIAMGERGTDVAREAAALVLTDDDFSSIVRAIALGRRIYDNIAKAMSYVLAVHVPIALVSMVPVLTGGPMVLLPLHVILMELIVDPACSVAFEMEPADEDIMHRPPRPPQQRLFTRRYAARSLAQGTCAGAVALVVYFAALRSGYGELDVRTLTFSTLIVTNLALILTNRALHQPLLHTLRTPNRAVWLLMSGALATLMAVIAVPPLRGLFRLAPAHADDLLIIVAAGVSALALMELIKWFARSTSVPARTAPQA